jgi:hypothetical protein
LEQEKALLLMTTWSAGREVRRPPNDCSSEGIAADGGGGFASIIAALRSA